MRIKRYLLSLCLGGVLQTVTAQVSPQFFGFEERVPAQFKSSEKKSLKLSSSYYKEGLKSLEWKYKPGSSLHIALDAPLTLDEKAQNNSGIYLWIYNEQPQQDSLRFEFLTPEGHVSYHFGFRLVSSGWRACWIGFKHMQGEKKQPTLGSIRVVAPNRNGRVFLDRLTFPIKKVNDRTTPDYQMPTNNSLSYRDLWHWCRVWEWEQYEYDLPLPTLTPAQEQELIFVEKQLSSLLKEQAANPKDIKKAYNTFKKANIQPSEQGFTGAPIVAPDELNRKKGEMSWNDLEAMFCGFAQDAYYNRSPEAMKNYFTVWNYAIDQGFAWGSGMGTNHHYGYQVRKIYTTAWLMRDAIWLNPARDKIIGALTFWSALQETRKPYQYGRDELLDSWHTLLMAKTVSALLQPNMNERSRALKGLSRWISTSLNYTPGTIGGIKVDGTTFHHGGFYPAYTTGVLAMIGQFIYLTNGTSYALTPRARYALRSAFLAMRNYSNKYEWGTGIGGRHPFGGTMREEDITAFAFLALSGDFSGKGRAFDHELAADYLRLCKEETPLARYFKEQGIQPAAAPEGFFVYNYGSAGIFRRNNWMVTLKGYTTDVWGSEIYVKDNRYGRYQSYGSAQIMGQPSRKASGYQVDGWDWNRLPGTTTIHLPFELLDAPYSTTMAHSVENFSGSSTLDGKDGMFAMKLMERDMKNFTKDFVARKSVFCFNNRMICLGSGISNSNADYPTETTLFQSLFLADKRPIYIEGQLQNQLGLQQQLQATAEKPVHLQDGYKNHYFVKQGEVNVQIATQQSLHEKTRKSTQGNFSSAWINHGKAPQNASYEYMVWIQPTEEQLKQKAQDTYEVIQCNQQAHIVADKESGTTAYAVFEAMEPAHSEYLLALPAETMVMHRTTGKEVQFSVCDPNLNISEKTYTTKEPSRVIEKQITLKGLWKIQKANNKVSLTNQEGNTILSIRCQHGQPVVFSLEKP